MKHDLKHAADSVLSGLTTTPEMQEKLFWTAVSSHPHQKPKATPANNRVKLKLNFSLSFGLPHMIVAAIVVIAVLFAPLFAPGRNSFQTWQSDSGEHYMVQGHEGETNQQIAEAEHQPAEPGQYSLQSPEEAISHYGAGLRLPAWVPERFSVLSYEVAIFQELRSCTVIYLSDDGTLVYQITDYFDPTSAYSYVEQDGAGAFVTLSDGREVYLTTNVSYLTATWNTDTEHILFSGSLTSEEAIRMAESVKVP